MNIQQNAAYLVEVLDLFNGRLSIEDIETMERPKLENLIEARKKKLEASGSIGNELENLITGME